VPGQKAEDFKTINTDYNEGSACLSLDGNFVLLTLRCAKRLWELRPVCSYIKKKTARGEMSKILALMFNTTGWESQPAISHSGDTLYFASNRFGGFGLSDIYFSVKDRKGNWGRAKNAGPIINTIKSEVSPFFHHKFNVLYFFIRCPSTHFGDFDIYKSYRQKDSWGEPKNIGPFGEWCR